MSGLCFKHEVYVNAVLRFHISKLWGDILKDLNPTADYTYNEIIRVEKKTLPSVDVWTFKVWLYSDLFIVNIEARYCVMFSSDHVIQVVFLIINVSYFKTFVLFVTFLR